MSLALILLTLAIQLERVRRICRAGGIIALDGERAVELARAADPDVVVLDLMLPGSTVSRCRRRRTFSDA